jgi:hypothetical protein
LKDLWANPKLSFAEKAEIKADEPLGSMRVPLHLCQASTVMAARAASQACVRCRMPSFSRLDH